MMNERAIMFAEELKLVDSEECRNLAGIILEELRSEHVRELFVKNI
jgi:hypothetical protein